MNKNSIILFQTSIFMIQLFLLSAEGSTEQTDVLLFRVGFTSELISGVDMDDAKVALNIMLESLTKRELAGYSGENLIFPDIETAIQEFSIGNIHLLTMTSINYLQARDKTEITPSLVSTIGDNVELGFVLLVQKRQENKILSQLQNKKIIIEKGNIGNIALIWIETLLFEHSLQESRAFFQTIKRVNKSSHAVLPVFFGQADACIVLRQTYKTMVALNPQVGKQLMILFESPAFLFTVTCFSPKVDERIKTTVMEYYNKAADDPVGKQFSMIFHFDKITSYKPEYLINIGKLYEKHKTIKAIKNGGKH